MIHVFIGTKAQYVKTAPVLLELERRGIHYNLIDSGQHSSLSQSYRNFFRIKDPDQHLCRCDEDITSVKSLIVWMFSFLWRVLINPRKIMCDIFCSQKGICLIHGDTPTTLLSLLAAKRVGMEVAHLESGLRSYSIFNPFPEELIRIIAMFLSDHLFAPSLWAYNNLVRLKVKGRVYLVGGNTNIEALRVIQAKDCFQFYDRPVQPYVVFSIHRAENILRKKRLGQVVSLVRRISENFFVLFCLHSPTKKQLKYYNFYDSLATLSKVCLSDLLPYHQFIAAIKNAYFIVTDGGSVQEESYYLNIPCLLMRNHTERIEGIDQNVYISKFNNDRIDFFLNNIEKFHKSGFTENKVSPSKKIVDIIYQRHHEILDGRK